MRVVLFTDIPVWVRPLAQALECLEAEVVIATSAGDVPGYGLIVNRLSTRQRRKDPGAAREAYEALREWEEEGRQVVNGSRVLALSYSKLAQAVLFETLGLGSPRTFPAVPGRRALPGYRALLKPGAGGFGKGIQELNETMVVPQDLEGGVDGWVEQEYVSAEDGKVHRVEFLGSRILYEASSTLRPRDFNYCLANTGGDVVLKGEDGMDRQTAIACTRVAKAAGMEMGAVEYLVGQEKSPVFIDLNPVSSLYPGAEAVLGEDPMILTARYLVSRSRRAG